MLTTILAYIIGFLGLVMIAVGIWGLFVEGMDYGIIGVICFGFSMRYRADLTPAAGPSQTMTKAVWQHGQTENA